MSCVVYYYSISIGKCYFCARVCVLHYTVAHILCFARAFVGYGRDFCIVGTYTRINITRRPYVCRAYYIPAQK